MLNVLWMKLSLFSRNDLIENWVEFFMIWTEQYVWIFFYNKTFTSMKVSCFLLKNKNFLEFRIYFLLLNLFLRLFFVFIVICFIFDNMFFFIVFFHYFFLNLRFKFFHIFFFILLHLIDGHWTRLTRHILIGYQHQTEPLIDYVQLDIDYQN